MTKRRFFLWVGFLTLATLCLLVFYYHQHLNAKKSIKTPMTYKSVKTIIASRQLVNNKIKIYGVVRAYRDVDIRSEVASKIVNIYFSQNQFVHAHDLLVELSHGEISALLEEQVAKLHYQESNYQRYLSLSKRHMISQDLLEELKSQLYQTSAKVKQLTLLQAKYFIRAPFDGMVGLTTLSIGQYVQPSETLLHLSDAKILWADLSVQSEQSQHIKPGLSVVLFSSSDSAHTSIVGKIIAVENAIYPKLNTLKVRAEICNQRLSLLPGAFVTGYIELPIHHSIIILPESAIYDNLNGTFVFSVSNGKAHLRSVEVLQREEGVEIQKGVQAGESIVSVDADQLFDGESVSVQVALEGKRYDKNN
ncbi:MAG: efflux RND transporter periplasmic adaptor subunit [Gammaproteobacteria bacterium]|nr:efflux RND transporter periplasmic adaptor subunit [Gammaproteobacteria bacterium]